MPMGKLDFEVRGMRNGKPGCWKLRATGIDQARQLATAQGVTIESVTGIRAPAPAPVIHAAATPSGEAGTILTASGEARPEDFYDRLWARTKRIGHRLIERRRARRIARIARRKDAAASAAALANGASGGPQPHGESLRYEVTVEFDVHLTGVTHHNPDGTNRQTILRRCEQGGVVILKREPGNRYDRNAIAVYTSGLKQIGYVPAEQTGQIAPLMDQGVRFGGKISALMGGTDEKPTIGALIQVGKLIEAGAPQPCPYTQRATPIQYVQVAAPRRGGGLVLAGVILMICAVPLFWLGGLGAIPFVIGLTLLIVGLCI